MRKKLILIGCGPHYQNRYHTVLEENDIEILLLIDLIDQKERILHFFDQQLSKPKKVLFLDEKYRNLRNPNTINSLLPKDFNPTFADGVLICVEPKARFAYVLWALQNDLPIFMDKPISAFANEKEIPHLLTDFMEMNRESQKRAIDVVVSTERRMHAGYEWVFNYIRNFIEKYSIPITNIDIHFAGGVWNLPQEYIERENHPFKYGYGILLHSGYHYVDLLIRFLSLNRHLTNHKEERIFQILLSYPADQISALGKKTYSLFLTDENISKIFSSDFFSQLNGFGETDLSLIGQEKIDAKTMTNFSLKIMGTSLCLRKESKFYPDLKGKIRQEQVIIHLGPLCSIHISSNPYNKLDPFHCPNDDFNVTIMTSSLIEETPVIRYKASDLFPTNSNSLNANARKMQLLSFLNHGNGNSSLASHEETMKFIHEIYTKIKTKI